MRLKLHNFLNNLKDPDVYLLHADMWPYDTYNSINLGIQEQNLVNIAAGIAYTGKRVIVYGVCGFVLYKAFEQIKLNIKEFSENYGTIIFCNAGHTGCYDYINRGHTIKDDLELCKILKIQTFTPNHNDFIPLIKLLLNKKNGSFWVRLGNDETFE